MGGLKPGKWLLRKTDIESMCMTNRVVWESTRPIVSDDPDMLHVAALFPNMPCGADVQLNVRRDITTDIRKVEK